jgi:hypothetical protein
MTLSCVWSGNFLRRFFTRWDCFAGVSGATIGPPEARVDRPDAADNGIEATPSWLSCEKLGVRIDDRDGDRWEANESKGVQSCSFEKTASWLGEFVRDGGVCDSGCVGETGSGVCNVGDVGVLVVKTTVSWRVDLRGGGRGVGLPPASTFGFGLLGISEKSEKTKKKRKEKISNLKRV